MPHVYTWGFLGQERRVTPQLLDGYEDTTSLLPGGFTFGALASPRGLSITGGLGVVNEAALSTIAGAEQPVVGGCGYDHVVYACGTPQQKLFGIGHNAHGHAVPGCADADVAVPRAFSAPARVSQVACGERHTLLLTAAGQVFAFGDNSNGQLGCSGVDTSSGSPYKVELTSAVTAVACGARHSLFTLSGTGGVAACGWNLYGQCGTGDNLDVHTPTPVSGLSGIAVSGVGAGISHSACVTSGGDVYVWGFISGRGAKLIPSDDIQEASPVALTPHLLECPALESVRAVRCGARHVVALRDDGQIACWGCNSMGQLGTGDTKAWTSPAPHVVNTAAMAPVVDVQCGWWHTLVLTQ